MGNCLVVVVQAENGRVSAFYSEDRLVSADVSPSANRNEFIASIDKDGGCGDIFHRNYSRFGAVNARKSGLVFGSLSGPYNLVISDNSQDEDSWSDLRWAYGEVVDMNEFALFGQEFSQSDSPLRNFDNPMSDGVVLLALITDDPFWFKRLYCQVSS
jgi:hypothetical protein